MISEHPISTGFYGLTGYQLDPRDRGVTHYLLFLEGNVIFVVSVEKVD